MSSKFYVTPVMDPATIRKANWEREPAQQIYLNRLVERHKNGQPPVQWNTDKPPPGGILYPSLTQLAEWRRELDEGDFDAISHDLETAGQFVICDGITPFNLRTGHIGRPICLRFRGHGGHRWWPSFREHCEAVNFLGDLLADPGLAFVGHNIVGFDIPFLESLGFTVGGPIIDTMVLMNRAYPELPKGLQFTATLFCGAPAWKRMIKDTDDGAEKT